MHAGLNGHDVRWESLISYHTAANVHGTKFKQLLHPRSQFPVANSCEVVEGEELKVLSEVAWQRVKPLQHPLNEKIAIVKIQVWKRMNDFGLAGEQKTQEEILLFSKTAGPEEVFHVEQLHP